MTVPVEPGSILAGKFQVLRVLGRGGMGIVVAARHLQLDEEVAIKFLLPEALQTPAIVQRFEREARAAVKIRSEHVVRVSDVGELESGAPYMVMELLRGRDLGAELDGRGPLPLDDVADYLLQACEAIAEAHSVGIVHRDLKPANLFLTHRADGSTCVKVLDFGISKVSHLSVEGGMTKTSEVMGSPFYVSPEQLWATRDVDARADVWSLGVILFQLLSNAFPFSGESMAQLCTAITSGEPAKLRTLRPDLPEGVERLVLDCLKKERNERVASVADFSRRLVEFAPKRAHLSAERIARISDVTGLKATSVLSDLGGAEKHLSGGPQTLGGYGSTMSRRFAGGARLAVAASVLVVVLIAVVALVAFRKSDSDSARSPAPSAEGARGAATEASVAGDDRRVEGTPVPGAAPTAARVPLDPAPADAGAATPSSVAGSEKPLQSAPRSALPSASSIAAVPAKPRTKPKPVAPPRSASPLGGRM